MFTSYSDLRPIDVVSSKTANTRWADLDAQGLNKQARGSTPMTTGKCLVRTHGQGHFEDINQFVRWKSFLTISDLHSRISQSLGKQGDAEKTYLSRPHY